MKVFLAGGAGFIGSWLVDRLLRDGENVTVYDNFSSGKESHLCAYRSNERLTVIRGAIQNTHTMRSVMEGHDLVIHLASNPDIAKAAIDPTIDFHEGTMLTHMILESMRVTGVRQLIYMSGSGVYGDLGYTCAAEEYGPLVPTSTYGASKLAGEAMISAYCHMFGMSATVFRFANVVGGRQTHGVGLDFLKRLKQDPTKLQIYGDGKQSKSYLHVSDAVDAILLAHKSTKYYEVFNVSTADSIIVDEIAEMAVKVAGLSINVFDHTGGIGGWKGDIPIVRLNSDKIRNLGWKNKYTSLQAMRLSLSALKDEV